MKIIHVLNSLTSGGAEVFVSQLCIMQKKMGHDVMLLTHVGAVDQKGECLARSLALEGVHQKHLNIRANFKKWIVPIKFAAIIKSFVPDVINVHLAACDLFAATSFFILDPFNIKFKNIVYLRTVHSTMKSASIMPLGLFFTKRKYDQIIGCSRSVMLTSKSNLKINTYINNGVELKKPLPKYEELEVFLENGENLHLVCVGGFPNYMGKAGKGQDLIIRAIAELKDESITVSFLGDGSLRIDLEKLALDLGVENQCHFLCKIKDVVGFFKLGDVFILPSLAEGLSIATVEAACMGLPLMLSDIESFHIFSNKSTLFHEVGILSSLVSSLKTMKKNHKELSREAYHRVANYRSEFSIEIVASKYIDEYKRCLKFKSA